jgi:hypothetical protein
MCIMIYKAMDQEQRQGMSADSIIANPIYIETRALTIAAPVESIWPWLAQMGSGRAGWYAFDFIDNGGRPSAKSILSECQIISPGDILPALPGMKDVFVVSEVDPPCRLILTVPDLTSGPRVSWEFNLKPLDDGRTRLIVRGRVSSCWLAVADPGSSSERHEKIFIEHVYGLLARLPLPVMLAVASFGHGLMQARQLHGIKIRAEA